LLDLLLMNRRVILRLNKCKSMFNEFFSTVLITGITTSELRKIVCEFKLCSGAQQFTYLMITLIMGILHISIINYR
jgi:hypothetical protein